MQTAISGREFRCLTAAGFGDEKAWKRMDTICIRFVFSVDFGIDTGNSVGGKESCVAKSGRYQ